MADRRTVQLGFDVEVPGKGTKALLLVGDERCALTYANDPGFGVAKRKKIKANAKIVHEHKWKEVMRGIVSVLCVCV